NASVASGIRVLRHGFKSGLQRGRACRGHRDFGAWPATWMPRARPGLALMETRMPDQIEWNFRLIGHHELAGFGGMGEGMSIQIAKDGRRIIWLAHESAPKNFTAVDVSDPRQPKVVVQTELPQAYMRSNSLEVVGDMMAVAYQCQQPGQKPAGFELFDIS